LIDEKVLYYQVLYYPVVVLAGQNVEQHQMLQLDILRACYLTVSITALDWDYHKIGLASSKH